MESLIRTQPKSVSFEPRGTTHDLTSEEIASMLLGIHDGAFYLAMSLVGGQDHRKVITHYLYRYNMPKLYQKYRLSDSERGRDTKHGFLWHLTYLATTEFLDPSKCVSCGGGHGLETVKCQECDDGWMRATNEQKARYLKIKPKRFNYWLPLYEEVYNLLRDWKGEAANVFNMQGYEI